MISDSDIRQYLLEFVDIEARMHAAYAQLEASVVDPAIKTRLQFICRQEAEHKQRLSFLLNQLPPADDDPPAPP